MSRISRITLAALCLLTAVVAIPVAFRTPIPAMAATTTTPTYDKDGKMLPPTNYREWIYLTSGIDMSYAAQPAGAPPPAHSTFDNVFVNPESYRAFLATGTWPDKTIMVLEARGAENPISINKRAPTSNCTNPTYSGGEGLYCNQSAVNVATWPTSSASA